MIEKYIKELLINNDQLTVPGLGTLSTSYATSREREEDGTLVPPHKVIAFSSYEADRGDLLRYTVMEGESLESAEYEEKLREFVAGLNAQIAIHGRYDISGLGTFSRDDKGDLNFQQSDDQNFLSDSFGLPKVSRKRPQTTSPNTEPNPILQDTTMVQEEEKKNPELIWMLIGIPLLFVFAFLVYLMLAKDAMDRFKAFFGSEPETTIAQVDDGSNSSLTPQQQQGFTPENTPQDNAANNSNNSSNNSNPTPDNSAASTPPQSASPSTTGPADNNGNDKATIVVGTEENSSTVKKVTPKTKKEEKPASKGVVSAAASPSSSSGQYHLVIGSFSNEQIANNTKKQLEKEGFTAKVVPYPQQNKYRVLVGNYASEKEATAQRGKIPSKYGSGFWVIKQ